MAVFGRPSQADDARAAAWRDWTARQNPLAIASLVLGAFSLTHAGTLILDGLAGVVLGAIALAQLRRARRDPAPADPPPPTPADPPGPPATSSTDADPAPVVARTGGRWLAWAGILLGGLSLVIAGVLYSMRPAG